MLCSNIFWMTRCSFQSGTKIAMRLFGTASSSNSVGRRKGAVFENLTASQDQRQAKSNTRSSRLFNKIQKARGIRHNPTQRSRAMVRGRGYNSSSVFERRKLSRTGEYE